MNVYHSIGREQVERYLFKLTYELLKGVVEEKSVGKDVSEEDKKFIAWFYQYGFVGVMLDWIDQGMKEDFHGIVEKMSVALRGTIAKSIGNFADA